VVSAMVRRCAVKSGIWNWKTCVYNHIGTENAIDLDSVMTARSITECVVWYCCRCQLRLKDVGPNMDQIDHQEKRTRMCRYISKTQTQDRTGPGKMLLKRQRRRGKASLPSLSLKCPNANKSYQRLTQSKTRQSQKKCFKRRKNRKDPSRSS